jgi:chromosome partitioning protein
MKKIAVCAMKGGVGKTMLAVNIAATLALEYDKKVLFIDTDPQSNSTNYLGIDEFEEGYRSIKDALENNLDPQDAVRDTYIEKLKVIGSSIYVTALEFNLFQLAARELRLKNYIEKNKNFFRKFDYVIFDTNPSMSVVNQNVFTAADSLIIVTEASTGGAKGIDLFTDLWCGIAENLGVDNKIDALVLNRLNERTNIGKEFKSYLKEGEYKDLILSNFVTESTILKDAESYKQAINIYKPNSKQHKQIQDVVEELIERNVL